MFNTGSYITPRQAPDPLTDRAAVAYEIGRNFSTAEGDLQRILFSLPSEVGEERVLAACNLP